MSNEIDRVELLVKVFENQQTLISNADSKANIALGVQTFVTTTVLGAAVIVDTFKKIIDYSCTVQFAGYSLFVLFIVSSIIGLALCIYVFKPRPPQEEQEINRRGITYFGHIKMFNNSEEYLKEINATEYSNLVSEFAFQNYSLALILDYKMKFVKRSTTFLFINILLGMALLLFLLAVK